MKILKINPLYPEGYKIEEAAAAIRGGGLVAFPTDTVYGIAADIFNEEAIRRLFRAKGKSPSTPVPVHIARVGDVLPLIDKMPPIAEKLMEKFWPGPLTIIFRASQAISPLLNAGSSTIGLRLPDNKIAIELILKSGIPLTAPSANITGKPPLRNAQEIAGSGLAALLEIIIEN